MYVLNPIATVVTLDYQLKDPGCCYVEH